MENNDSKKTKKGFTVSELEGTAKRFATEIGLAVIFVITALFTLIWGGAMMVWSIILCMVFGIVGALLGKKLIAWMSKVVDYVYKDKVILIALGVVLLIVGMFIPVLIFALVGLVAGGAISISMKKNDVSIDIRPLE